jgi:multiple sugar transport system permease protein
MASDVAATIRPQGFGSRRTARSASVTGRYIIAAVVLVGMIAPYVYIVLQSLAVPTQVGQKLVPTQYSLHTFRALFSSVGAPWVQAIGNSVAVTLADTVARIVIGALAGYAIAVVGFRGSRLVSDVVLLQMFYPAVILVVPLFLMVQHAGLYDSLGGMILPYLADAWTVFMYTAFFRSIPKELVEAARLDGAGHVRIVFRVLVPLLGPVTTVVALYLIVQRWTEAFWDLIIVPTPAHQTLNVLLTQLTVATSHQNAGAVSEPGLVFAGAAVLTLPLVALFLIFSKRFASGFDMSLR